MSFTEICQRLGTLQGYWDCYGSGDLEFYFSVEGKITCNFPLEAAENWFSSLEEFEAAIAKEIHLSQQEDTIAEWDEEEDGPVNPNIWLEELSSEDREWFQKRI